jgi:hypothetical protein
MKKLSNNIVHLVLAKLDSGLSLHHTAAATGASLGSVQNIRNQHHPDAENLPDGHPKLLSTTDSHHACRPLVTGKATNAVKVAKALTEITNTTVSAQKVHWEFKNMGLKAVVKKKCLYSARSTDRLALTLQLHIVTGQRRTGNS